MTYTYEQAYRDHCYLWQTYGSADDMTGGYVDQEDLARLLKSPTKATAKSCLIDQMRHWFSVGPDGEKGTFDATRPMILIERDPEVAAIHERLGLS